MGFKAEAAAMRKGLLKSLNDPYEYVQSQVVSALVCRSTHLR
jgi:hypothetical protein